MNNPTKTTVWQTLKSHWANVADYTLRDLFAADSKRFQRFSLQAAGLFLDYSKNLVNDDTLDLLIKLAQQQGLQAQIEALFIGQVVNNTEGRPALHTALRDQTEQEVLVNNEDIKHHIKTTLQQVHDFSADINNGVWRGYSDKPFTDVVNIGIGGSHLGPALAVEALTPYKKSPLRFHFVANVDGTEIASILHSLNPETTLFIISSKSFTTQETLLNAKTAKQWLSNAVDRQKKDRSDLNKHFIAITAAAGKAEAMDIPASQILALWDWVGGRYSLWSAVGLPIALALGYHNFCQLLAGAHAMDQHFRTAELRHNMPVILALLSVWYINFFAATNHAILPYDALLRMLIPYLQQAEMESNGKRVQRDGNLVNYATGAIIWGGVGCNGQHAFHQLLHQGTPIIPADFILPLSPHHQLDDHHRLLVANCLSQSQALLQGKSYDETVQELINEGMTAATAKVLAPHKVIPGNRPSNMLLFPQLTPAALGALIALYEHKIFVQSVIWHINPFDQWGVELGKQLSGKILQEFAAESVNLAYDASTQGLINYYQLYRKT